LYTQKQWCDKNPDKCKTIIRQANAFVRPFRNIERDYYLSFQVIQRYMDLVHFEVEKAQTPQPPITPNTAKQKK
jgi:hypothetical protein